MKIPACLTSRESMGVETQSVIEIVLYEIYEMTLIYDLQCWPLTLTLVAWTFDLISESRLKSTILMFDLDLWPMTLTFNPILPWVKVNFHAKNQGRRSNSLAMRVQTDIRTHTQTHTHRGLIILLLLLTREVNTPASAYCMQNHRAKMHINISYKNNLEYQLFRSSYSSKCLYKHTDVQQKLIWNVTVWITHDGYVLINLIPCIPMLTNLASVTSCILLIDSKAEYLKCQQFSSLLEFAES